jgi:putative hydrolase of the HAD superfamily
VSGSLRTAERQNLIVDADDTLWENNIYFERAFEDFCDFLAHSALSPDEVRAVLDEIEIVNNKTHGYGTANFARNLTECYHKLAEREVGAQDLSRIMSFTEQIVKHPIEIIAGVAETLEYLSERHSLTLFTKGDPEEQKLEAGSIRPGDLFRPYRHSEGERRAVLRRADSGARARSGAHLDDRQLAQVRRESGAGSGYSRGVRAA